MPLHPIRLAAGAALALTLGACAGRTPQPVPVVQATDTGLSCQQVRAEIEANTAAIADLGGEQSAKVAQNIAAGVGGLFLWPLFFAMDFQDAAGKEESALVQRNRYLSEMYAKRCDGGVPTRAARVAAAAPVASAPSTASAAGATSEAVPTAAAPVSGPVPYEGTPFRAFNRNQLAAYCAQDWETRTAPDGRTLYNPCRVPDAFD